MRKQLFGVAVQAFYSVITLLALRVWIFNKDLSLGFLLHIPVLIFQGHLLKQPFQVEPVKVCDLCPNHLVSNRCLLPCSLISCSLYFLKKIYYFFIFPLQFTYNILLLALDLGWRVSLPLVHCPAPPHFWDLQVIHFVILQKKIFFYYLLQPFKSGDHL